MNTPPPRARGDLEQERAPWGGGHPRSRLRAAWMRLRRGAGVPSKAAPPLPQTEPLGSTPACEMGCNTWALGLPSPPTVLGSGTPSSCRRDPSLHQGKTGQERGCRGLHGTTLGDCHSAQQTGSSMLGAWGLWRCIPGRARLASPPCQAGMAPASKSSKDLGGHLPSWSLAFPSCSSVLGPRQAASPLGSFLKVPTPGPCI